MDENGNPINPNGDLPENPAGSQPETITAGDGNPVNPEGAANRSPEEVEFNRLSGNTQARISEIIRERNEYRSKAELFERNLASFPPPPPAPATPSNSDVQAAVGKLSEIGMAPKDYVDQKVNQAVGQILYQSEIDRLGQRLDGSNGLPAFNRDEYEDYVNRHPQFRNYAPEDVYNKMYADEIFDWKLQNQGKPTTNRTTPSLKPTRTTVREEVLTPELVEQRLREPDGPQWYEKNKDKVNAVLAKMADNS